MPPHPHWKKQWHKTDLKPKDEIFWHATTIVNAHRLYGPAAGIQPELGGGMNGDGFYVCPRRTDYGKVMAFRNRKEGDPKELFILKILVEGFYGMQPYFSDGLAGTISADVCDFVGSRWDSTVIGPSENSKPDDGGSTGKGRYDAYKGAALSTPGYNQAKAKLEYRGKVVKGAPPLKGAQAREAREAKDERRKKAVNALWEAAKANQAPAGAPAQRRWIC